MIAADPNSTCEQAKSYYYQYLSGDTKECIPTHMLGHIDRCRSCQAEVGRLKGILTEDEKHDGGNTGQTTDAITTNLKFHFAYLGALVDCNTLKLFLPGLAIPALEVSIPTPITVHLDKCQKCTSDFEAIRQLKLSDTQLARLGQLFAEKSRIDTHVCAETQSAIASVGAMAFENTSAEMLKHLCKCPECRKLFYENRKDRIEALTQKSEQSSMPCDAASATDIFDYVVPYGIDPDHGLPVSNSSTSHLINCPKCLNKMQKLHETVYGILERRESGIVTCFKLDESAGSSAMGNPEDLYIDWPIEVQVLEKSVTGAVQAADTSAVGSLAVSHQSNLKQKLSSLKIRPFIKPTAAAAAIILAALLLFNAPTARAVNLGQIYKALERIKNVCITTFYKEESNKTQEIWVSQTLNVKMLKTRDKCTLWDLNAKSEKSKNLNTGSIATTDLNGALLMKIKETMEGTLGLLPFNSMPEAPEGANWLPIDNKEIETAIPGTQVYELTWTVGKLDGFIVYNKWRGYIDIETKLPGKIEWWDKKRAEDKYELLTIIKLVYPDTTKVQAAIRDAGF